MRSRALRLAAAALAATFTLAACGSKQQDVRLEPPLVAVTRVKPAGLDAAAFTGFISARVESDLGFRVAGKVVERLVDAGVTVRSGQPLMRIDQTDYALSLTAQVQAVNAARAKSVQASADEERYRRLIGTGAISTQTYEQAKASADSARADLSAAEAQEAVVRNQAEYSVLKADADGVIMQTLAEPGHVVSAGEVVVKLAHAGPREATIYLPESVRPAIGSLALVTLYGSSSRISWAHLRQLSDAADPQSRTYEARYVLEGDAAREPLGATVTVQIAANESDRLSEVPLGAIYDNGKGSGVWVINPRTSSVALRSVQIRGLGEEAATISGDVRVGEQIVALGAAFLHEGAKVRVANAGTASQ